MNNLTRSVPPVGTKLYREVFVYQDGGKEIDPCRGGFDENLPDRSGYKTGFVFRVSEGLGFRRPNWVVNSGSLSQTFNKGLICFCRQPIPDDWTYFEVIHAGKNHVVVKPVVGDKEELLAMYRY